MSRYSIVVTLYMVLGVFAGGALHAKALSQPEFTEKTEQKPLVKANSFMVAAAHPLAVSAGYDILESGGSAADAAVAIQLVLNLVEPQSSGLGGGAFALYWNARDKKLTSFDGRERAPLAATPQYWLGTDGKPLKWWDAVVGGRSVGVPGTLKLLYELHGRYGKKPWGKLFTPAIELARKGFLISPRLAASIARAKTTKLDVFAKTRSYFFNPDGSAKSTGTRLKNQEFAKTLQIVAQRGPTYFYEGALAAKIVAVVKTSVNPGILTLRDMKAYKVIEREPVCAPYRSYVVCGMGPPSSGALTVAQILGMLLPFNLAGMGPGAKAWHLFAESSRLAYADRALYMADSDYVKMPLKGLIDPAYLRRRSALISPGRAMQKAEAGKPPWKDASLLTPMLQAERSGTSHFVVVDKAGDMISMTTTIETGFGSRLMVGGFLLNNELTDFSRAPQKHGVLIANRVEGGKRPRSSMSPTMVFSNQKPVLLIGSPGGSRIISYVAQALVAILDWNMPLDKALALGHVANRGSGVELEEGTGAIRIKDMLEAKGHKVKIRNMNSGLHAISIVPGALSGAADPRREGGASGR